MSDLTTEDRLLTIVHLSDIHVKEADGPELQRRLGAVFTACTPYIEATDELMVFITGDVAFSGKESEYAVAHPLLSAFKSRLTEALSKLGKTNTDIRVLIVPGNHDRWHNETNDDVYDALVAAVENGAAKLQKLLPTFTGPHAAYYNFEKGLNSEFSFEPSSLVKRCSIETCIGKICVVGVNTSYMAKKVDEPGRIDISIMDIQKDAGSASLLLMHHPPAWMTVESRKVFLQEVAPFFGFVFSGHEHLPGSYERRRANGAQSKHIEGGALVGERREDPSSFVLFQLRRGVGDDHEYRSVEFEGDPTADSLEYTPLRQQREWLRVSTQSLGGTGVSISEGFREFLEDEAQDGINQLIFGSVRPDQLRIDLNITTSDDFGDEPIAEHHEQTGRVLIVGEEKSGKTTTAKSLFLRKFQDGCFPVFLDASRLYAVGSDAIEAHFRTLIEQQYDRLDADRYFTLERSKRLVIIDNHHALLLKQQQSERLDDFLRKHFDTVYSIVDATSIAGTIYASPSESFVDYARYEIMPLDRLQIRTLIRKWCIAKGDPPDDPELQRRVSELYSAIDATLSDPIIPSYPFFVLSLLSQADTGRNTGVGSSTQGYIYEGLLIGSILKAVAHERLIDVENVVQYASHLSVYCFDRGDFGLAAPDLQVFHKQHADEYGLNVDYQRMADVLTSSAILVQNEDRYEFKFRFCYYYFVGRHIADHLDDTESGDRLSLLLKVIHTEEGANIISFAAHRAGENNKREIIEKLIETAAGAFANREPSRFDVDLRKHFGMLQNPLLNATPPAEPGRGVGIVSASQSRPVEPTTITAAETDVANEYLKAIRSIAIVGQIVRGFQGKLKAKEKSALIDAAVGVTLRTTKDLEERAREALSPEDLDVLAGEVVSAWSSGSFIPEPLKDDWNRAKTTAERVKLVKDKISAALLSLTEIALVALIRQTSRALGSTQTLAIFNTALEERKRVEGGHAYDVVLLSNSLEFGGELPDTKLISLHREFQKKGNAFGAEIIRRLTWLRLVSTNPEFSKVQLVCQQLGINYSSARVRKIRYRNAAPKRLPAHNP